MTDNSAAYQALQSRDARFDGVFFVGVTTTGIYCRPVCRARTPLRRNCRFFSSAEAAEKAAFRPCLRCRPELAPGQAPVDRSARIAHLLAHRIGEGLADEGAGLEQVAARFSLSSRQLRRIIHSELGVSPIELIQTRRLLLAKQLLTDTRLPVTEIAFASGFTSLRRFNDAFRQQYRMAPTHLRRATAGPPGKCPPAPTSTLTLGYRPPYDWTEMLRFLGRRMMRDVEWVDDECYARTVSLGGHTGWFRVTHAPEKNSLRVTFTHSLTPVLPALLGRLRALFDLTARPDLIASHLSRDKFLRTSVRLHPGLRVPGAFDGFEMAVRAILGQQITVQAATTLAGRLAAACGEKIITPFPELTRLSPPAARIADSDLSSLTALGLVGARAASLRALARACEAGELPLGPGVTPEAALARLTALPGIGPWTAHYIALRALRWPDAFPKEDVVLRQRLGGVTARRAEELSQPWRPWRSYAVMHLWRSS